MIEKYEDLSVGKYLEILAVDRDEALEEIDRQVRIVSILSGVSEDELLHMNIGQYTMMARKADFLRIQQETQGEPQARAEYEAGGLVLCPVKDYRKLETGQYIDFKAYAVDIERYFVEFLSVILVPEGHRYTEGYDIAEVQEAIKAMPMSDAMEVVAFFLASYQRLITDSLNYSEQEAKKLTDPKARARMLEKIAEARTALQLNGGGSPA